MSYNPIWGFENLLDELMSFTEYKLIVLFIVIVVLILIILYLVSRPH
jgi:hypothetical protein